MERTDGWISLVAKASLPQEAQAKHSSQQSITSEMIWNTTERICMVLIHTSTKSKILERNTC